jgi:hypothetical protein
VVRFLRNVKCELGLNRRVGVQELQQPKQNRGPSQLGVTIVAKQLQYARIRGHRDPLGAGPLMAQRGASTLDPARVRCRLGSRHRFVEPNRVLQTRELTPIQQFE